MDGITQALSKIQPELKAGTQIANLGSTGYNLYNQYQNQQYQNKLRDLSTNPTKMNAYAEQFTKPLTAGLQTGVANNTQAYLAQRGLSDSPQISEQVQAQAIAPYIQENQNKGYSNALQALGLGGGSASPDSKSAATLSALTKAFSQLGGAGSSMSAAQLAQLLQQGKVQTNTLDTNVYEPDYGAQASSAYTPTTVDTSTYEPDYAASLNG